MNLTPPWENTKDAASQTGGTIGGGNTGTVEDSAGGALATDVSSAGGANGEDAPGAGGAGGGVQIDSNQVADSGGAGGTPDAGGALDTAGTVATGGTLATGGTVGTDGAVTTGGTLARGGTLATGGALATGGQAAGGAGGTVATGGSTVPPDAKPPADQAPKNDTTSGPEVDSQPDAGIDAPEAPDASPGPDLPTDPAPAASTVGLVAYYPCDQTTGTTLLDSSDKGNNANLAGATTFAAGQPGHGNALQLAATNVSGTDASSSGGYATLPGGLLTGATEMTVAAWFRFTTLVNFQRVFDFGTSSATSSMYFTPRNANGLPQFTIRQVPDGGTLIKQDLLPPTTYTPLAVDTWYHVAVVLDGTGGHLYLDGSSIETSASRTGMTFRPTDLGAMPNDWIGRSEFVPPDPFFDGMIDEFRVYTRALTPAEIAILATR